MLIIGMPPATNVGVIVQQPILYFIFAFVGVGKRIEVMEEMIPIGHVLLIGNSGGGIHLVHGEEVIASFDIQSMLVSCKVGRVRQ
ncbi:hypothetical protein D1872_313340 [compost metagenome]